MNRAEELRNLVLKSCKEFAAISSEQWNHKTSPTHWSKKEILGHLIDSAHNNHRRFVVTQYEQNNKIVYRQDDWVMLNDYQSMSEEDVILIWKALNLQIARLMAKVPTLKLQYTCDTGKDQEDLKTLDFLMSDYITHMEHHLKAVFK